MSRGASLRKAANSTDVVAVVAGVLTVAGVILGVTVGMDFIKFDVMVCAMTLLVLTLISIPILRRITRTEGDPSLFAIMVWGMLFKAVFTIIRYYFITVVYGDNGDAGVYSMAGSIFMEKYRHGDFALNLPIIDSRGQETVRIAVVVGFIYVVTGVSRYAASFIFSWLCFMGQILMFRALKRGVPEADGRRYLTLLMFLPSLLFWPSSIGKEALMVFGVGVLSYGAAQLLGSPTEPLGVLTFLAGASVLFFIRPHMALIAICALAFASGVSTVVNFSGETDKKASSRAFTIRIVTLVLLIGAASVALTQLSSVLSGGADGGEGLSGVLARTKSQTAEGGSQFIPPAVTSPVDIPNAVVTVLFRPFPWEARNANNIIASGEGVILAGLLVVSRRRVLKWALLLGKRPYLVFALAFALIFIIAFSYIGNFGILARQRTQMIPLFLTILGMPVAARTRVSWFGSKGTRIESPTRADRPGAPHPVERVPGLQSVPSSSDRFPRGETK